MAKLFVFASLIVGLILSLTVFFKIDVINVTGECDFYTRDQIIEATGIKINDNLFRFSASNRERDLFRKLPYIDSVEISRKLPGTITINVTQAKDYISLLHDGKYIILSKNLKILNVAPQKPQNTIEVTGVVPISTQSSEMLSSENESSIENLKLLISALNDEGLFERVMLIDVSDKLNLSIKFESRFLVMYGTSSYIDYKTKMLAEVVNNKLSDTDVGKIDLSTAGKAIFSPLPKETDAEQAN
ncbi:MAG: FtsQ-type POTRA domain-containing protein [Oscillospiraceae bacterium]